MKFISLIVLLILVCPLALAGISIEKRYEDAFESLNQDIQTELLYGDLSQSSVRRSLRAKIGQVASLARQVGGRKHSRMVKMSFERTIQGLRKMNKNYREALDMTYANGLTGREMIIEALSPENNRKILQIYQEKKESLSSVYQGKQLRSKALEVTLEEIENEQQFNFLKVAPLETYVLKDPLFSFLNEKCVPAFGEEDLFVLLFGFNRCWSQKYRIDRYTVGLGYYNARSGFSYVTGLKIGKKDFYGVGAKVLIGVKYAGGIGVFLGNGLMFSLDLEQGYGIYAGATYINIKPKSN